MRITIISAICLTLFITTACQEELPKSVKIPPQAAINDKAELALPATISVSTEGINTEQALSVAAVQPENEDNEDNPVPSPPVFETFQGEPQLTLFPRAGDYRPEEVSERLPFWNTFIDHLVKATGVSEDQTTGNRAWVFRGIKSIDSTGYFSPLGVKPNTRYKVDFTLQAELPDGASAGVGIIEFDQFLWIPGQYTEKTFKEHFLASQEGKRLTGNVSGEQSFTFNTGPKTGMVHLVLFREGKHDRNNVIFDDIRIAEAK